MLRALTTLRRSLAAALMITALALPAAAADFTEAHLAAAREAINAAHASDQFNNILVSLAEQTKALFQRSNPSAVNDIDVVVDTVALDLAKRRPELDHEFDQIWAARFTEDELKEIAAFYESPIGKKLGETMPIVIQDSVRSANIWRDALSTDIVTKSREELNKRGYKF